MADSQDPQTSPPQTSPPQTSPPRPTPRQLIAVAVVQQGDMLLVGRRAEGSELAGYQEFPGGKVRPGESPATAAARECREETGLDVYVDESLEVVDHTYPHGTLRLHFFRCRPSCPQANVRPPFRWVPRHELRADQFPPANAAVLARFKDAADGAEP